MVTIVIKCIKCQMVLILQLQDLVGDLSLAGAHLPLCHIIAFKVLLIPFGSSHIHTSCMLWPPVGPTGAGHTTCNNVVQSCAVQASHQSTLTLRSCARRLSCVFYVHVHVGPNTLYLHAVNFTFLVQASHQLHVSFATRLYHLLS